MQYDSLPEGATTQLASGIEFFMGPMKGGFCDIFIREGEGYVKLGQMETIDAVEYGRVYRHNLIKRNFTNRQGCLYDLYLCVTEG